MAIDTLTSQNNFPVNIAHLDIRSSLGSIARFVGYGSMAVAYVAIFMISFATLGLIEIRQANLKDFKDRKSVV